MGFHNLSSRIRNLRCRLVFWLCFRTPQGQYKHRTQSSGAPPTFPLSPNGGKEIVYLEKQNYTHSTPSSTTRPLTPARARVTIHVLSDDVLLEIFDRCRGDNEYCTPRVWIPLVHVCRRWRHIIFASPRHLQLLLFCDVRTPAGKLLDIWPQIPIAIHYSPKDKDGEENVIAALECHNRISWIVFDKVTSSVFERFASAMHEPYPALIGLQLQSLDEIGPVIPDPFLGGFAPRLESFFLEGVAFPALPKLVVKATHLTKLWLQRIPDAGYIEPEAMASCLTALPKLEELHIGFQSPRSRPFQTRPRPSTHTVLPALAYFVFRGDTKYLEDLIAPIRAPNLDTLNIWLFTDFLPVFTQLHNFINSAERLRGLKRAHMELYPWSARLTLGSPTGLDLGTRCDGLDQRVLWMAQLCKAHSLLLSHVESLEVYGAADSQVELQDSMDAPQWLELFRSFTTVQGLYISKTLGPLVARALQDLKGGRAAEVLPALRSLFLGGFRPCGSVEGVVEPFLAARRLSDRPVVIECWEQDLYWDSGDASYDEMEDVGTADR